MTQLLGYSDERLAELLAHGAFGKVSEQED